MTDQDLTPEAVERYRPAVHKDGAACMLECRLGDWVSWHDYADLSTALEAERARAESAEARERALLTTYDEDRKALVENTSLRSRLKAAEAKLKDATTFIEAIADGRFRTPSDNMQRAARVLASLEGDKP